MSLIADYVKFCAKVEGQGVTLTFDTHVALFTHLVDYKYKIKVHRQQQFPKKKYSHFHFFPYMSICDQI